MSLFSLRGNEQMLSNISKGKYIGNEMCKPFFVLAILKDVVYEINYFFLFGNINKAWGKQFL